MNSTNLIKKHEGKRNTAYRDSLGILTVGYGRNLERPMSDEIIDAMFAEDMIDVRNDCLKFSWYHNLDQVRQAVIENMIFNLGYSRFSRFKNTIAYLSDENYAKAAVEMLDSKWAKQVGYRADELSKMILTGDWPE